ncbi:MAG: segregation/condensation protein A [Oscillospiraceae bacterium]|nr:segregation/condensation protein A [Oscillospiraceae bacterium]
MERPKYKTGEFEGPLDLLLHLVTKNKLSIFEIEISSLLEQYLEHMNQLQSELQADGMEIAGEFLEMAARLIYIKTMSLMPKSQEAEDLKQELTGRLIELSLLKDAAAKLSMLYLAARLFVREPLELDISREYNRRHDLIELTDALRDVSGKSMRKLPPPVSAFTPIVAQKEVSVTSKIIAILRKLYNGEKIPYGEFFAPARRNELVAVFLAMLELLKSSRIELSDDNEYVYLCR